MNLMSVNGQTGGVIQKKPWFRFNPNKKTIMFLAAILCGVAVYFLLAHTGLSTAGRQTIGILSMAIILWATNAVHPSFTSLIILVSLVVCRVLPFEEAGASLGDPLIWMIATVFIIGQAVEKTGLAKRIALNILNLARGNLKMAVLMSMLTIYALVFILPTIVGRVTLLVPILIGMVEAIKAEESKNFARASFIGITYASTIGALTSLTGASSMIFASGYMNSHFGADFSYLRWMEIYAPYSVVSLIAMWFVLILLFPPGKSGPEGRAFLAAKVKELGRPKTQEVKIIVILLLMISAWIFEKQINLSIEFTSVMTAAVLFLPGVNILKWHESINEVDWGIVILFSVGLTLAHALETTGTSKWIAGQLGGLIAGKSLLITCIVIICTCIVLRLGINNTNALMMNILPVSISVATSTGISPVWLGTIAVAAATFGLALPTQSPQSIVTYSYGYYSTADLLKSGLFAYLVLGALLIAAASFYWPLIGIAP